MQVCSTPSKPLAKVWAAINKDDENQCSRLAFNAVSRTTLIHSLFLVALFTVARILVTGRANRNQLSFEAPSKLMEHTHKHTMTVTPGTQFPKLTCVLGRNEGHSFLSRQVSVVRKLWYIAVQLTIA